MNSRDTYKCLDCKIDTSGGTGINEYYMVQHALWYSVAHNGRGMLCIGCLEQRLGRQLIAVDFTDCPLNMEKFTDGSERLKHRMRSK